MTCDNEDHGAQETYGLTDDSADPGSLYMERLQALHDQNSHANLNDSLSDSEEEEEEEEEGGGGMDIDLTSKSAEHFQETSYCEAAWSLYY